MSVLFNIRGGCKKLFFTALWLLAISPLSLRAQHLRIAIAANLQPVMKVLKTDFEQKTRISIVAISGPSGNLATQIKNGAPFDVFLSADTDFPDDLYKSGFTTGKPVVYAAGKLIICSTEPLDFTHWPELLPNAAVQKIAIGNPAIAPYGKAAVQALTHEGIYGQVQPKIVLGESITQVNTYITTGVVQAGFTTLSVVNDTGNKTKLYYKLIDPKTYSPIEQGMVLLKQAKRNPSAERFYSYILGRDAKKIFSRFGYRVQY